jgi:hypothetical protein
VEYYLKAKKMELFENLPKLNWDDLETTSAITVDVCKKMADPDFLRQAVEHVYNTPELFDLCECHELDDKIVIYNDLEKGYRIRLRLGNEDQYERAHNHRFPFTTYILHGTYYQSWYNIDGEFGSETRLENVTKQCSRVEKKGAYFTISDKAIHSTQTDPFTVSLVICGPPKKDNTQIIHMKTGEVWSKWGKKFESQEQIEKAKMSRERFNFWKEKMEEFSII